MIKVQARALQPGDKVGSGEQVIWVGAGVYTPRGKVEVVLKNLRTGRSRTGVWGASTLIGATRSNEETAS